VIALIQRVRRASVVVEDSTIGQIDAGLLALVCAEPSDTEAVAQRLVDKLLKLRIFSGPDGKMNLDVRDVSGGVLLVSQFTLAADTSRGNRPSFVGAAAPDHARTMFANVVRLMSEQHATVASGRFGADMQVELVNDGPVTIPLTIR
jgi:D-aminoacyl-tRNA deacylase